MRKTKYLVILFLLSIVFLVGCGQNKNTQQFSGYVCDVKDNVALLFNVGTLEPFYLDISEMEETIEYGDMISFSYKELSNYNELSYYEDIKVIEFVEKTDVYWPATSNISLNYSYRQAINSKAVVMDNEYIVSGDEYIKELNSAISKNQPYYLRVIDFGDGSSCCITDVFYNGNKFLAVEDSTRNSFNEKNEVLLIYKEYQYLETYDINGIELTYLTNTKDIAKTADESGLFEVVYDVNYTGEPLDMFWLYYDVSNYVSNNYNQSSVEDENNTLTFEDGIIPCPNLILSYQHYFTEDVVVSIDNEDKNKDEINDETNKEDKNETNETTIETFTKESRIVLKKDTLEVEPRDVLIEKDGKVYKRTGVGTLELDLSGYAIVSNRSETFKLSIDENYSFDSCNVTVYNFKDLDNLDAIPLEEFSINEYSTEITMPECGVYIYEVLLEDEEYSAKYVFVVDRED